MENIYHYLNENSRNIGEKNEGSRESYTLPLIVNCAGRCIAYSGAVNDNPKGRLDYYLIYVISGELKLCDGERTISAGSCSTILYPPKTGYKFFSNSKDNSSFLWVHFTGNNVGKILKDYGIEPFPCVQKTNAQNSISSKFKRLFDGFAKNDHLRERDLSALLDRLLIEVSRSIESLKTDSLSLSRSIRYINEYFTSPIKITELAKMEKMCMTTYNLKFKKQMGIPPTKYIIKLRVDLAKELISQTSRPIREIGELCGYYDINFFSKVFKENVGVSPLTYRKQCE